MTFTSSRRRSRSAWLKCSNEFHAASRARTRKPDCSIGLTLYFTPELMATKGAMEHEMPDRLIRDEIMDSDRYLDLSSDTARLLFLHLVLLADDLGNVEVLPRFLRRRALISVSTDAAVGKLLSELADNDLIRLYEHGGKPYAHIPRFGQRLRYMNGKHPRPPVAIEDPKIRELLSKKSDSGQAADRPKPVSSRQKRSEEKRRTTPSHRQDIGGYEVLDPATGEIDGWRQ